MKMNLTPGELDLLIGGLSDDIAFVWVLIHLGVRSNPPPVPDWVPSDAELDQAFDSLERLTRFGLIRVGRLENRYQTQRGRKPGFQHVEENLEEVARRVEAAVLTAKSSLDWEYSCWIVNTDRGHQIAGQALAQRNR